MGPSLFLGVVRVSLACRRDHVGPSLFLSVAYLQYVDLFLANGGESSRYALQSNLLDGHWLMSLGGRKEEEVEC